MKLFTGRGLDMLGYYFDVVEATWVVYDMDTEEQVSFHLEEDDAYYAVYGEYP